MAAVSHGDSHALLDCAVCLTNMIGRHPRALACLHTFCTECLQRIQGQQAIHHALVCPSCRQETFIPEGNIERLPENFHLKALSDVQKQPNTTKLCAVCNQRSTVMAAEYKCTKCDLELCFTCKAAHETRFQSNPHPIISYRMPIKWVGENIPRDVGTCRLHGNANIEYWCQNCYEILCPMCAVHGKHTKHDIHSIGKVLQLKLQDIVAQSTDNKEWSDFLQERSQILDRVIAKASDMKEKITQIGNNMKAVIDYKVAIMTTICEREYIQSSMQERAIVGQGLEAILALDENIETCNNVEFLSRLYQKLPVMEQQLSQVTNIKQTEMDEIVSMPEFIMGSYAGEITIGAITHTKVSCKLPFSEGDPSGETSYLDTPQSETQSINTLAYELDDEEYPQTINWGDEVVEEETDQPLGDLNHKMEEPPMEKRREIAPPVAKENMKQIDKTPAKKAPHMKSTGATARSRGSNQKKTNASFAQMQRALGVRQPAVMELDLTAANPGIEDAELVLGLPDQGALLVSTMVENGYAYGALFRVDREGLRKDRCYYAESPIMGALLQNKKVLVMEQQGRISRCWLNNLSTTPIHTYRVDVTDLSGGAAISRDHIALTRANGEIFTFRFRPRKIELKKEGTDRPYPIHLSCHGAGGQTMFALTAEEQHQVGIYDAHWRLKTSFGGLGKADGKLNRPKSSTFLPSGNLLVLDVGNNRVTEFTRQGGFIRHWVTENDGVTRPRAMSFMFPHLWVVAHNKIARYRMFAD